MIKQLIQLVMPKQLGVIGVGTALALGSTAGKIFGSKKRENEINDAQAERQRVEGVIAQEQAGRSRRQQIRNSLVAQSTIEATANATGNTSNSGAATADDAVQANLAENLGNLNTQIATNAANTSAQQNVNNAGQKGNFELLNDIANPFLVGNIDKINTSVANAFNSTPTGG